MAKEKLSEFERYKRKLNIRKKLSAIFWLLLITAVAAGGVVWFGAFSKSEFGVAFRSQFTRDEQFPKKLISSLESGKNTIGGVLKTLEDRA